MKGKKRFGLVLCRLAPSCGCKGFLWQKLDMFVNATGGSIQKRLGVDFDSLVSRRHGALLVR